ncbi:hypothetical protein ES703_35700 [subsurface metagenome]|nr:T9SS type A sorting domain-containing protein [bacterium]
MQFEPFNPTAIYLERTVQETPYVYLMCRIENLDLSEILYEDTLVHCFAANEEFTAMFAEPALETSGYIITFWAEDGSGSNISHPPLTDIFGYTGIDETPASDNFNLHVFTSVGSQIVLRYSNSPQGFHAEVFDALGRRVDELNATGASGTITWGKCYVPGVYFIRVRSRCSLTIQKVILIR